MHTATNAAKLLPNKGFPALTAPSEIRKRPETCVRLSCDEKGSPSWHYKTYGRAPEPYTRVFSDIKNMRTRDCTIQVESCLPAHVDMSRYMDKFAGQGTFGFLSSGFPRVQALCSSLPVAATRHLSIDIM